MVVVVILGILASIAIPVYMKFVGQAKTGEARYNLATIVRHIEQYWARSSEQGSSAAIVPGPLMHSQARYPLANDCGAIGVTGFLANGDQVPPNKNFIMAKKYQPSATDWGGVWEDLHFAITQPIAYGYCYEGGGTADNSHFTVFAYGDIDADDTWSQYARIGIVVGGQPVVGNVAVFSEDE
jgi:type II secretory pathway pseudopilin PulG